MGLKEKAKSQHGQKFNTNHQPVELKLSEGTFLSHDKLFQPLLILQCSNVFRLRQFLSI